jgi:hypothetical protein
MLKSTVVPGPVRLILSIVLLGILFATVAPPALLTAQSGVVVATEPRYDQRAFVGTNNSFANPDEGYDPGYANQTKSTTAQLDLGARYLNPEIWVVQQTNKRGSYSARVYHTDDLGYTRHGLPLVNSDWDDVAAIVVVGHDLVDNGYFYMVPWDRYATPPTPFKSFSAWLAGVTAWLEAHPSEVVTIDIENNTHPIQRERVESTYSAAAGPMTFYPERCNPWGPDRAQPGGPPVAVPLGRPDRCWDVRKYGYPTQSQLTGAGYRIVRLPDTRDAAGKYEYVVRTVSGEESVTPFLDDATLSTRRWHQPHPGSANIDDFARELFVLDHAKNWNWADGCFYCDVHSGDAGIGVINLLSTFEERLGRLVQFDSGWPFVSAWRRRAPNFLVVDYYDDGYRSPGVYIDLAHGVDSVRLYAQRKLSSASENNLIPTYSLSPASSNAGWHNTDVLITMNANDMPTETQRPVSRTFPGGADAPSTESRRLITDEGVTTVSFAIVDLDKAIRSDQAVVDIKIDKTPPAVYGDIGRFRPPNQHGWYNNDVTVHFIAVDFNAANGSLASGFACGAEYPPDCAVHTAAVEHRVSEEGMNLAAEVTAADRAGNTTTVRTSPYINIDKTPPDVYPFLEPAPNANGWNNSDYVAVHAVVADALSGIDEDFLWRNGTPIVRTECSTDVIHRIADKAGNVTEAAVNVKLDRTPPSIGPVAFNQLTTTPPGENMYPFLISYYPEDNCTDLAQRLDACRISVSSSNAPNGTAPAWTVLGPGGVELRAVPGGPAPTYTVTVSCTDLAGNNAARSITITPQTVGTIPQRSLTGSGYSLLTASDRASFEVDATAWAGASPGSASVKYSDTRTQLNFASTDIGSVVFADGAFIISGNGTVNGAAGYTFTATAADGTPDTFGIVIRRPEGTILHSTPPLALAGGGFSASVRVPFAGEPGSSNCHGQSVSALARQFGSLRAAASALGFASVRGLQDAVRTFCEK